MAKIVLIISFLIGIGCYAAYYLISKNTSRNDYDPKTDSSNIF